MKKIVFKFLTTLISLCFLTSNIFVFGFASEGTGKLSVENSSAKAGESISVKIRVMSNPGIIAMKLKVNYDSSVITLDGVENGTVFSNSSAVFGGDLSVKPYVALWEDGLAKQNNSSQGELLKLNFSVSSNAPSGKTHITISVDESSTFNYDLNNVSFAVDNGYIDITTSNKTDTKTTVCQHPSTEWIVVEESTCNETGTKESECTTCGKTLSTESIPVTSHSFGKWMPVVSDNTTQTSEENRVCQSCNYSEKRTVSQISSEITSDYYGNIASTNVSIKDVSETYLYQSDLTAIDASASEPGGESDDLTLLNSDTTEKQQQLTTEKLVFIIVLTSLFVVSAILILIRYKKQGV